MSLGPKCDKTMIFQYLNENLSDEQYFGHYFQKRTFEIPFYFFTLNL